MATILLLALASLLWLQTPQRDAQLIFREGDRFVMIELITDSTFAVKWGKAGLTRSEEDLVFDVHVDLIPAWSTPHSVGLEATCGSGCWFTLILPFDDTSAPILRHYPVANSLDDDVVVYIGRGDTLVYAENFRTGHITPLVVEERCGGSFNGDCLVDVDFVENGVLFVRWYDTPELTSTSEARLEIKRAK